MGILATIKARLGWATGDRRAEAEGKLKQLDDDGTDRRTDPDAVLDEAELHVRSDHGDLAPGAEPDDRSPKSPPEPG